jgi:hypothetical protein
MGCYAIKADLPASVASKQAVDDRYKDLGKLNNPHVQADLRAGQKHARSHDLVAMLTHLIRRELNRAWISPDVAAEEDSTGCRS